MTALNRIWINRSGGEFTAKLKECIFCSLARHSCIKTDFWAEGSISCDNDDLSFLYISGHSGDALAESGFT